MRKGLGIIIIEGWWSHSTHGEGRRVIEIRGSFAGKAHLGYRYRCSQQ
jgi:hypothetical protein